MSAKSKKQRGHLAVLCAASAFWLAATMASPVGSMKPFCEPDTARSTPHSSMRKSMLAMELTPSTIKQRRMPGRIERAAHAGHVAGDAGGRLVVADEHGLDVMPLVGLEARLDHVERDALAPLHVDDIDVEPVPAGEVGPQVRELAEHGDQHLVAGRERVGHRRLPAARARRREHEDLALLGPEHLLQVAEQRQREGREIGRALVLQRHVHGLTHRERHVGGAWDEETMEPGHCCSLRDDAVQCCGCRVSGVANRDFRHPHARRPF